MSKNEKNKNIKGFQSLNAASAHGLNDAIKTRKRGRLFFKLLMVFLSLAAIGGGIAIYFILNRKPKTEHVEVSVDVWMREYPSGVTYYRNLYEFKAGDESKVYGRDDEMESNISKDGKVEIVYAVINNSGKSYNYRFSLEKLDKEGFYVDYYIGLESNVQPLPENNIINLQQGGNFAVVIRIKLEDYAYNHECSGYITMDISVI